MNSLDPALARYLPQSKQDILENYHGSKKKSKKRKLASTSGAGVSVGGLLINDDSEDIAWGMPKEDDEDGVPVVEHRTTTAFKPVASTSAAPAPSASTAQDEIPADEAPLVVGSVVEEAPTANSSAPKKLKGGLQTASELREENQRRRAAIEADRVAAAAARHASTSAAGAGATTDAAEETVYRDASGKRIDTKAAKAELARQKRKELEKEMQKMEWGKGVVQREDREKAKRELEDIANKSLNRYADDEDLNSELKDVQRWNDPAARFLTGDSGSKKKSKGPTKPKYAGPMPAPNRFGIPPGYRWDGVDRSNGFEKEFLQSGNKRKVRDAAARVYSTEDM